MTTFEDYLFTKNTKWFLWGTLALLLGALIFHAGVVEGSHKRMMQGHGPGGDFEAHFPFGAGSMILPRGFMPGNHGALGTIASVTPTQVTLTTRDGMVLNIDVSTSTEIVGTSSLEVGQMIIVVGDPHDTDNEGDIDARLIRIFPN